MADRSTAAVDVAGGGGAAAPQATSDGVTAQTRAGAELEHTEAADAPGTAPESSPGSAADDDAAARAQPAPSADPAAQPDLHSGHKLARRYRLEECLTRADGFSSWRAVDEKLRRAVGVHILPAGHPHAPRVLAAARSAALLADPRFVQVLDAVEENDLVYVVHEWLPDATELTAVLTGGPLSAYEACQLVRQVAEAMAVAHEKNLFHLLLTPHTVLRTESGQYRIRGLAVAAALRGLEASDAQREDTEAIGALLYAALTQRWPYPENAHGLSGLPNDVGLVAPDQVRAGVHRGLADIAMRALVNDGATATRHSPACTTTKDLAKAVAALPKIRRPDPEDSSSLRLAAHRQMPARPVPPVAGRHPQTAIAPPPPSLPGRSGRLLKWGVSALLLAALGLGSWQVSAALLHRGNNSGGGGGGEPSSSASPSQKKGQPLKIADGEEFSPVAAASVPDKVPAAYDGKTSTAWITPHYDGYANFGNLPSRRYGGGVIVDLGSVKTVTSVDITMYRSGQTVEVLAADASATAPTDLSDFEQRITGSKEVGGSVQRTLAKPIQTRYVLVHITKLPPENTGSYRGGISEIRVLGEG